MQTIRSLRADLKAANREAREYLTQIQHLKLAMQDYQGVVRSQKEALAQLRQLVEQKDAQIQALDEFSAVLAQTIQDYQRGRAVHA